MIVMLRYGKCGVLNCKDGVKREEKKERMEQLKFEKQQFEEISDKKTYET
jgi:hypothetical protein